VEETGNDCNGVEVNTIPEESALHIEREMKFNMATAFEGM
jgi:hypothetical protein